MSKVLFNPTKEKMSAFHEGIETFLQPCPEDGHKIKVPDNKANHILNYLGPRGICVLEYGDESKEQQIAEAGLQRNKEFKIKQVVRYNQDNQAREQSLKPYIEPTAQVKRYAEEVGIKLIEPYVVEDTKNKKISDLEAKLTEQSEQMQAMMAQMTKMMEDKTGVKVDTPDEANIKSLKEEYRMMQKSEFKPWAEKNKTRFPTFPLEVQEHIAAKWSKFFEDEPLPT